MSIYRRLSDAGYTYTTPSESGCFRKKVFWNLLPQEYDNVKVIMGEVFHLCPEHGYRNILDKGKKMSKKRMMDIALKEWETRCENGWIKARDGKYRPPIKFDPSYDRVVKVRADEEGVKRKLPEPEVTPARSWWKEKLKACVNAFYDLVYKPDVFDPVDTECEMAFIDKDQMTALAGTSDFITKIKNPLNQEMEDYAKSGRILICDWKSTSTLCKDDVRGEVNFFVDFLRQKIMTQLAQYAFMAMHEFDLDYVPATMIVELRTSKKGQEPEAVIAFSDINRVSFERAEHVRRLVDQRLDDKVNGRMYDPVFMECFRCEFQSTCAKYENTAQFLKEHKNTIDAEEF